MTMSASGRTPSAGRGAPRRYVTTAEPWTCLRRASRGVSTAMAAATSCHASASFAVEETPSRHGRVVNRCEA